MKYDVYIYTDTDDFQIQAPSLEAVNALVDWFVTNHQTEEVVVYDNTTGDKTVILEKSYGQTER